MSKKLVTTHEVVTLGGKRFLLHSPLSEYGKRVKARAKYLAERKKGAKT